ncbi:MAG: leucine--tRNA ligase [Chloroflexota bacterium]|nr:leucine--tRNA ligase [Chloroflexota bacterium]
MTTVTQIPAYDPSEIEPRWRERWEIDGLYRVDDDDPRPPYYFLTMLPYTSGDLHIGHWYAMAPSDVAARWHRMQGKNVLFPLGFDAFGLPAENAAINNNTHPKKWTYANVENMTRQLKSMGASFDWNREFSTSDPEYYRWTQWWFLKLYEHGLAYRAGADCNYCPPCGTVLANEQVIRNDEGIGICERCDAVVEARQMEQWMFRITDYADELLEFDGIDWPEPIKLMQRNWIGRSEGAEISFPLGREVNGEDRITVFTTRPDTLFGCTFMVLAPEHPLVAELTTDECRADVEAYIEQARRQNEIERQSTSRAKTGVFTGAYTKHPFTGEDIQIWIADYVLLSYGTGAVMGVPAHDERDFAFASERGIPIPVVIAPPDWDGNDLDEAYTGPGTMVNSGRFDGTDWQDGKLAVADALDDMDLGGRTVSYRLRDWLISRQRYWGAPIPMIYCESCGTVPVPEEDLPVLLPDDAEFLPTGASPLERHEEFVNVDCPTCNEVGRRETDTMDTFMCSNWYMYRYVDPHNHYAPIDPALARQWLPIDTYTGGAEHAVMHLFYARFFAKAARDMDILEIDEPFARLFNQGTITKDGHKMSKSRGNVVNPDEWVDRYGADTVRLYLMFLGPWEAGGDWDDSGISGQWRWLNRVWNLALGDVERGNGQANAIRRATHAMIGKVSQDIERFRFNTMIAAMMEFTNELQDIREQGAVDSDAWREAIDALLLCLAPSAPHICEELWLRTGHDGSIHEQTWPEYDESLAQAETVTVVVQVNGKLREKLALAPGASQDDAESAARASTRVADQLGGKTLRRVIWVPDKLLNFVAN